MKLGTLYLPGLQLSCQLFAGNPSGLILGATTNKPIYDGLVTSQYYKNLKPLVWALSSLLLQFYWWCLPELRIGWWALCRSGHLPMWISSDRDPNSRWQIEHSRKCGGRDTEALPIIEATLALLTLPPTMISSLYIFTALKKIDWLIKNVDGDKKLCLRGARKSQLWKFLITKTFFKVCWEICSLVVKFNLFKFNLVCFCCFAFHSASHEDKNIGLKMKSQKLNLPKTFWGTLLMEEHSQFRSWVEAADSPNFRTV